MCARTLGARIRVRRNVISTPASCTAHSSRNLLQNNSMTTIGLHSVLNYLESLNLSSSNKRWLAEHYFGVTKADDLPVISSQELESALTVDEVEDKLLNMVHAHFNKAAV